MFEDRPANALLKRIPEYQVNRGSSGKSVQIRLNSCSNAGELI
jgi:hypothetical protein